MHETLDDPEIKLENTAITVRNILSENKPDDYDEKSILMMALAKEGIKPLATFGVYEETKNIQIENAKRLNLQYKIYPPNSQGYSEFVVSNKEDTIKKYDQLQINVDKDHDSEKYNQELGKIFGFTDNAVNEHVQSSKEARPAKYWQDICGGGQIPPEMVLVYAVADMIPASLDDKQAFQKGKEIKVILDKIDPQLTQKYSNVKEFKETAEYMRK